VNSDALDKLHAGVRDVPDFPKKGIIFKDITPILKDGGLFRSSIDLFLEQCVGKKIDKIVGIESAKYSLEYGEAEMELHIDAIVRGERVVLIDDLLATGGTSASAAALIKKVGGELVAAIFLIELEFLKGREKLKPTPIVSFLKY
jgi:adenine phosphoribosyltransferase